ncbi:MAG: tetratricopeptide repeat protein [Armatimonadota bacterium]
MKTFSERIYRISVYAKRLPSYRIIELLLLCAGLVVVIVVSYAPVLEAEFVGYDDELYVTKNPYVQAGLVADSLAWACTTFAAGNWHPVTWISHMLDCQIYGLNPWGHHLTNLILHVGNALLLFALFYYLTGSRWISLVVAMLFGVHPLHVESVAWVSERKDLLSTLFGLLTLITYTWYSKRRSSKKYAAMVLLFALGLLSKPMLVSLPLVMLILDYWPLGRFAGLESSVGFLKRLCAAVIEKIPLFIMSAGSAVVTCLAQKGAPGSKMGCLPDLPIMVRIDNALVSYIAYLVKMVYPARLAVIYPHPQSLIPLWKVIGSAFAFAMICLLTFRTCKKHPYVFAGWLWYVITLVPVIGLVQVGEQAMADRYTYIPLIGIFVAVAWYGSSLLERFWTHKTVRITAIAFMGVCLLLLMARNYDQTNYWRDSVSLFSRALEVTNENYVAHLNLAVALEERGDYEGARYHYEEALRIQPDWTHALYNYAVLLAITGDRARAMGLYRRIVRLQPDHTLAHYNLGVMLDEEGKIEAAIREYRAAISSAPDFAPAYVNLAVDLYELGQYRDAWRNVREAQRLGFAVNEDFIRALTTKVCQEP